MRIGILTYHRSINDGAVMQCYSLSKRLQQELPDAAVEVIDYHMPKVAQLYQVSMRKYLFAGGMRGAVKNLLVLMRNPALVSMMKARNHAFEACVDQLPLSEKTILDDGTDALFEYINEHYDVVVAGSDAIWNYNVRGYPNPYYLSNKIQIPMLSYAASCYGMVYEKIAATRKKEIGSILSGYSFLGVRDDETAKFARDIGVTIPSVHTCDPTVFLDVENLPVNAVALEGKLKKRGFDFTKPAIGVMSGNQMCRMVRKMYGRQYQIVSLQSPSIYADVDLSDLNPYEWSYTFRYLKLTVTSFFHGTLVSLRNGVPVIALAIDSEYSKTHMTKVQDFMKRIDMEDCYFHTDYSTKSIAEIKKKADQLLNKDARMHIVEMMDQEARSADTFFDHIRTIVANKEKAND